jgi:hypothetical protein
VLSRRRRNRDDDVRNLMQRTRLSWSCFSLQLSSKLSVS